MKVLAVVATPRKQGNSRILVERFLSYAPEISSVFLFDAYKEAVSPCRGCNACFNGGKCVVKDSMQRWYPLIEEVDALVVSHPVYFYGPPAPLKAFIDRCQPFWFRRFVKGENLKTKDAVLINVAASMADNLFVPSYYIAKVWLNSIGAKLVSHLAFGGLEREGEVLSLKEILRRVDEGAREFFGAKA